MKILMCVPNISEGGNLKVVEQVVGELRGVAGVKIQDVSSDPDHNRSVLTYLGEPEAVLTATQAMAQKAFALLDHCDRSDAARSDFHLQRFVETL